MIPLSVAIVARDEADRLEAALRSVAFASEVLVLDSGSTDGTPELAERLGARVQRTDWPGHVAQKNRALGELRHDWVLSIDADERVSPELAAAIQIALAREPEVAGYAIRRRSWWQGAPIRHGLWGRERKIRLFRRDRARWVGRDPHDRVELDGPVGALPGDLEHHPYRDLGEHLATIDRYTALSADRMWEEGVRAHWWDLVFRPPLHFVNGILLRLGLLDGARGLCVAALGSVYVLLKWARLWLRQREGA
jgi:glycosyltransferase involved in cell wall biosynthesis